MSGFELVVNTSILWPGLDPLERVRAAARAGVGAVEMWWPFDGPEPREGEVDALIRVLASTGVRLVGLNLWAGDLAAGERGAAADPDRVAEFRSGVDVVRRIADRTGLTVSNALYGQRLADRTPAEQDAVATANLAAAVDALERSGVTVVVEPLLRGANGAYPLTTALEVVEVLDRVDAVARAGRPALLLDTFHLAGNGDDLIEVIRRHGDRIGHVQLADHPGRGRPGTGRIDVARVLAALEGAGYAGAVAAEHVPDPDGGPSFAWADALGLRRRSPSPTSST